MQNLLLISDCDMIDFSKLQNVKHIVVDNKVNEKIDEKVADYLAAFLQK